MLQETLKWSVTLKWFVEHSNTEIFCPTCHNPIQITVLEKSIVVCDNCKTHIQVIFEIKESN